MEMAWYIPLLIFCARICDVSIGTVRTMMVVGGHRYISAILGFFEVVIWVLAVGGAIRYLTEPTAVAGYAAGFACGVLIGMWIEERLAIGYRVVQIISRDPGVDLAKTLREHGWRVTEVEGSGREGSVQIAFLVIRRRELPRVRSVVHTAVPSAFLTVERVDPPHGGGFGGGFTDNRFSRRFLERIVVRK